MSLRNTPNAYVLLEIVKLAKDDSHAKRISRISHCPKHKWLYSPTRQYRDMQNSKHVMPIYLIRYAIHFILPSLLQNSVPPRNSRATLCYRLYLIGVVLARYNYTSLHKLVLYGLSLRPVVMPQSPITGYQYPSGLMTNSLNSSFRICIDYGKPETPQRL